MNQYRRRIMRSSALTRLTALAAPLALGLLLVVPLSGPSPVRWLTSTKTLLVHDNVLTTRPPTPTVRVITVTRTISVPSHSATSTGGNGVPPELRNAASAPTHSGNLDGTFNVDTLPLTVAGSFTLITSTNVKAELHCANGTSIVTSQVVSDGSCTLILTDLSNSGGTWTLTPDTTR
jgi:hypothetical protein